MIELSSVYKRYHTKHGVGPWVLNDVNIQIPKNRNIGLIGRNGAGKSTLLRLIGGVDYPDRGQIKRDCSVSWPVGQGGLEPTLTGRQNSKFICRIFANEYELDNRIRAIRDFSELGDAFENQVYTYSSGMRSRLQFALSVAFEFDVYLSDEVTSAGDRNFRSKAKRKFIDLAEKAGLIMVAHDEATLKNFCQSAIFLRDRKAFWFENIDDAFYAYQQDDIN